MQPGQLDTWTPFRGVSVSVRSIVIGHIARVRLMSPLSEQIRGATRVH